MDQLQTAFAVSEGDGGERRHDDAWAAAAVSTVVVEAGAGQVATGEIPGGGAETGTVQPAC